MFTDIVFPSGNEEEFIRMAKKLCIGCLIFCYPVGKFYPNPKYTNEEKVKIKYALFANNYKSMLNAKNKNTVILSNSNDRQIFEHCFARASPLILFEIESIANYDSLHSRHSGLNHILCSLAHKNNIVIGLSFSQILSASFERRPYIIGRMAQNIKFAAKYKARSKLGSFARSPYEMRSYHDMTSLGIILGMHQIEAKKALVDEC